MNKIGNTGLDGPEQKQVPAMPKQVKRLDKLKAELCIIKSLSCLSFDLMEQCEKYYKHEINCIEQYNSPNPVYYER